MTSYRLSRLHLWGLLFLATLFCPCTRAAQTEKVVYVDGTTYPHTFTGLQKAITDACGKTLVIPAGTITMPAGTIIVVSCNDIIIQGSGDTTLLDFSAGTSGNNNFTITGSRVTIRDIKVIGNRVTGGASTMFNTSSGATYHFQRITSLNAGSIGFYSISASDIHVEECRVLTSGLGAIFADSGSNHVWILDNTITSTNQSGAGGHGGISVRGNNSTFDSDYHIHGNTITGTIGPAIQVNSVSMAANRVTRDVYVTGNRIYGTTTFGEGIAWSASNVHVIANRVDKTQVTGILSFGPSSNSEIASNIVSDTSQLVSGMNCGIQVAENGGIPTKITIAHNIIFDEQGSGATTACGINFNNSGGGSGLSGVIVTGNICRGTVSTGCPSFNIAADADNVFQSGNIQYKRNKRSVRRGKN